jgi:hypothetical protein
MSFKVNYGSCWTRLAGRVIVGFEGSSTSERFPTRFSISLAVYREGENTDS